MTGPGDVREAEALAEAVGSMAASMLALAARVHDEGSEGVAWVLERAADPEDLCGPGFWAGVLAVAALVATGDLSRDALGDHEAGWRGMFGAGTVPDGREERS